MSSYDIPKPGKLRRLLSNIMRPLPENRKLTKRPTTSAKSNNCGLLRSSFRGKNQASDALPLRDRPSLCIGQDNARDLEQFLRKDTEVVAAGVTDDEARSFVLGEDIIHVNGDKDHMTASQIGATDDRDVGGLGPCVVPGALSVEMNGGSGSGSRPFSHVGRPGMHPRV